MFTRPPVRGILTRYVALEHKKMYSLQSPDACPARREAAERDENRFFRRAILNEKDKKNFSKLNCLGSVFLA